MKQTAFFLILIFLLLAFSSSPVFADEELFNFSIEPVSFTVLTKPGKTHNLSATLINSNSKSQTAYPYAFDWDVIEDEFHFTPSSWFNFYKQQLSVDNSQDYLFNFSLTVPQNPVPVGEYYKIFALSNRNFNAEESNNPAIMVGTPIIAQVSSETLTGPLAKEDLYSLVILKEFRQYFNPFTQSQTFRFQIKNEGNLSAVPSGYISIKNSKGEPIETLPFNKEGLSILPNSTKAFELSFRPERAFVSELKAEVWLGYKNSFKESPEEIVFSANFFYVSPQLLLATVLTVVIILLINRILTLSVKPRYRYLSHLLILIAIIPAILYLYKEIKMSEKILGEKKELQITATVRQTTGIKVVLRNGQRVVIVSSSTPKGFRLYSLQGTKSKLLGKSDNNYSGKREITLSRTDSRFPMLILSNGF